MRASGIFMHISSLPGPYGIGTLGKSAYAFVDFLAAAGQKYWQILPLAPTGYGNSPYLPFSTFAGNPYFIDPTLLLEQGLLTQAELDSFTWGSDPEKVDYGLVYRERNKLLTLAFHRFQADGNEDYRKFFNRCRDWLEDYGLFMALKEKYGGASWQTWPLSLMMRLPDALEEFRVALDERIRFQYFLQYEFHRQWFALRSYANEKGIRIIGDVPIYLPLDSAEVWANPELFQLTLSRRPKLVAGSPPDSIYKEGQTWGNPLYNWDNLKTDGYDWWIRRLKAAGRLYDMVRLNHFHGFVRFWAIPVEEGVSQKGRWVEGPGEDFIRTIRRRLPRVEFIADDLGGLNEAVQALEDIGGYPGMRVVQYAFDSRGTGIYAPNLYPENSVCYSSIHDDPPLKHWLDNANPPDLSAAKDNLKLTEEEGYVWGMIRGGMASASRLCIVQMQDYLGLGKEARMNHPGTQSEANWAWRSRSDVFTSELAARIAALTRSTNRSI